MGLFPMFVDITGRCCLILGGGPVALRKARSLILAGGEVHVWAREICDGLMSLANEKKVILEPGNLLPELLLEQAYLVVCATSDAAFNERMRDLCRRLRIFVNCATEDGFGGSTRKVRDQGAGSEESSFIFPALIVRDGVCVGISTFPPVPSLSKHLRRELEPQIPLWYGTLGKCLADFRERLREMVSEQEARTRIMGRLTDYGISHEGIIPEDIFEQFVSEEGTQ